MALIAAVQKLCHPDTGPVVASSGQPAAWVHLETFLTEKECAELAIACQHWPAELPPGKCAFGFLFGGLYQDFCRPPN